MATMTKTDGQELLHRRNVWLKKKDLTVREFADSVGLDYNCCFRWFNEPRRVNRLFAERVKLTHLDFPFK